MATPPLTYTTSPSHLMPDDWLTRLDALDITNPDAVRAMVMERRWWHSIDLGYGIVTPGHKRQLEDLGWPDLRGKTVLDIGCWDGGFSFEAERRGGIVTSADLTMPPTYALAHKCLNSRARFIRLDLRNPEMPDIGTFDVVLFLGVLYHLPDPVTAFWRVSRLAKELLILETDTDLNWRSEPCAALKADHTSGTINEAEALFNDIANWFLFNRRAVEKLSRAIGFPHYRQIAGPPEPPTSLAGKLQWKLGRQAGQRNSRLIAHMWR